MEGVTGWASGLPKRCLCLEPVHPMTSGDYGVPLEMRSLSGVGSRTRDGCPRQRVGEPTQKLRKTGGGPRCSRDRAPSVHRRLDPPGLSCGCTSFPRELLPSGGQGRAGCAAAGPGSQTSLTLRPGACRECPGERGAARSPATGTSPCTLGVGMHGLRAEGSRGQVCRAACPLLEWPGLWQVMPLHVREGGRTWSCGSAGCSAGGKGRPHSPSAC